ncbi:MAG: OmpA family protein [Cyclobacteriaceae bacterium]
MKLASNICFTEHVKTFSHLGISNVRKSIYIILQIAYLASWSQQGVSTIWQSAEERGDQYFEWKQYAQAQSAYEAVLNQQELVDIDSNTVNPQVALKLAETMYKLKEYRQASLYYKLAIDKSLSEVYEPDHLLHYAECLLSQEQLEPAKKVYNQYYQITDDELASVRFQGMESWEDFHAITRPTTVEQETFNSESAEIVPKWNGRTLYYSTQEQTPFYLDKGKSESEQETFSLVRKSDSTEVEYVKIAGMVNVTSPAFISTEKVIISASKVFMGKAGELKLYLGSVDDKKWTKFKALPFLEEGATYLSPSFSAAKDTLYFSSDQTGGEGGFDIYYSIRNGSEWSNPEPMKSINTAAHELYPFSYVGALYFSSDGHPGMGGLDLYVNRGGSIENLGSPLNTSADEFGLTYVNESEGYFTSNRSGGKGRDDIYKFVQTDEPDVNFELLATQYWDESPVEDAAVTLKNLKTGRVEAELLTSGEGSVFSAVRTKTQYLLSIQREGLIDYSDTITVGLVDIDLDVQLDRWNTFKSFVFSSEDNSALSNPTVFMEDLDTRHRSEVMGNPNGYFEIKQRTGRNVSILITKEGYSFATDTLKFEETEFTKTYELKKVKPAQTLTLRDLLYELDQYHLKEDYIPVLDSIAENLMKFDGMRIVVFSHTDSRGSDDYNLDLSQKRAESVRQYLINKGVAPTRVAAVGKGELELLNRCTDGVRCSDDEHQANRRTELKLYRMN